MNRDGYFTNGHLLRQVDKTIIIFERIHPQAKALFLFDNAPSHRKVPDNGDRMNAGPGDRILFIMDRYRKW